MGYEWKKDERSLNGIGSLFRFHTKENMYKCPECGYTSEEGGMCPMCNVEMEVSEVEEYDPED